MAVIQDRIGGEVFRDFAETGGERSLAARAADAAFGVAHDAGFARDGAGFDQRPDGQVGRGRIAAGIRDQPRARDAGAAELRQSVGSLGEKPGLRMRPLYSAGNFPEYAGERPRSRSMKQRYPHRAGKASTPWKLREGSREIRPRFPPHGPHRRCISGAGDRIGRAAGAGPRRRDAPAGWARRADDAKESVPVPRRCSRGNRGCRQVSWGKQRLSRKGATFAKNRTAGSFVERHTRSLRLGENLRQRIRGSFQLGLLALGNGVPIV